jgi:hypothetical protein
MTRHARHLTQTSLPLFDALVETRVANRQQVGRSAATLTFACEVEQDSRGVSSNRRRCTNRVIPIAIDHLDSHGARTNDDLATRRCIGSDIVSGIVVLFRTCDPDMLYELPRLNSYAMAETLNKPKLVCMTTEALTQLKDIP